MVKLSRNKVYNITLPPYLDNFLNIVEKTLNDMGYKCATTRHLTKTLGDETRIPKDQYYTIIKEETFDPRDVTFPPCLILRDVIIKLCHNDMPKGYEMVPEITPRIEIIQLRKPEKAKDIADSIEEEIKNRIENYKKKLEKMN